METTLITGASSGIGLELAKLFAADKSNLVLVARRTEKLTALAEQLQRQHGITTQVLTKDLARPEAPREVFEELNHKNVVIDVLVNNAGFGFLGSIADLDLQRQLDMIQVNITALVHLTRLFLPGMIERNRGGILNVGSTAAFQPGPNMAVYYASKAFVLHFTEGLAEELKGKDIRVSCLSPGPTVTEFAAHAKMESAPLFRLGSMSGEAVARIGYRGFRKGKVVVIPGFKNKLGTFGVRLAPRFLVRKITKGLQGLK
ncbi:MAG TPA: SDR family oxidoreductase [Gemmataceae bacterium]|nr:SDR family oxidoreductase [Gemmataceae bacterium]